MFLGWDMMPFGMFGTHNVFVVVVTLLLLVSQYRVCLFELQLFFCGWCCHLKVGAVSVAGWMCAGLGVRVQAFGVN